MLCAQRKVKCDKAPGGCANCTRARVDCVYKAPPPPRRRKKGVREIDIHAKLRLYEDTLKKVGIDPENLLKEEMDRSAKTLAKNNNVAGVNDFDGIVLSEMPAANGGKSGVLVSGDGKSRYLDNTLWTSLKGELRDSKELILDASSSEDEEDGPQDASSPSCFSDGGTLLLGTPKSSASLRPLHPQPVQIFKLWQAYLDNVNPLFKIFHTPTVQQIISNASGNLDDIPKNVEALLFSMYCISVESLGDGECHAIMGEPKAVVSRRFRAAAQHALLNASFLKTSDLMVLQALLLLLASLQHYDARVIWILTGVAGRIGQRIGLHRDPETLGLPPFECEIRRRLWWQTIMMDGFAEKLAGTAGTALLGDVRRPSNLNDSDLFPGMKELPKEHEGATEMMFFLIRCQLGEFLKRSINSRSTFDGVWNKLSTNATSLAVKDKAIDELEALYERKFLQYCDPSIAWHFMCSYCAKAIISMLRFIAHNPEHHTGSTAELPQSERDMLFRATVQVIGFQNMAYTTKDVQGFLWHINSHFQWKSLIYFIAELRYRTQGPEVDNAWKQVQLAYDFHPNFTKEHSRRALPIAVGNLTLKAWDAYIAARGVPDSGEPYFIQVLRARKAQREASISSSAPSQPSTNASPPESLPQTQALPSPITQPSPNADPLQSFQWDTGFADSLNAPSAVADISPLDPEQMSWATWDNLLEDFEMQGSDGFGIDNGAFNFGLQ